MNFPVLPVGESKYRNAKQLMQVLIVTMVLSLVVCVPLFSQNSNGALQGAVYDQSGGVVVGATVSIIDVSRGTTRALVTDSAGQYVANNLNPGTYTVRAEAKGFQATEHPGVVVQVGQNIRVDLVVQPGAQTQTVTVTGEAPAIDTTDATLGGAISNEAINALPLNGRNFGRLLMLRPGVVTAVGGKAGQTTTNGRRAGNDLYVVDGIAQISSSGAEDGTMNGFSRTGDSSSILPIDAIQDFNTEVNPKAEFGYKDGSVVNVGIKSGTNSLHGTAYAFGRDASATDAANSFTHSVTPATLEQFGASAGGRIIKDKLFWFANYEGLKTVLGDVTVLSMPTISGAGVGTSSNVGSWTDTCLALGYSHLAPLSVQLAGLNPDCSVHAANAAVAGAAGENLFPMITGSNTSNDYVPGNHGVQTLGPLNNGIFKGDYSPNAKHHFSGLFYKAESSQVANTYAGELTPQGEINVDNRAVQIDGSWTWTPNSSMANDLRAGYAYVYVLTVPADVGINPKNPWPTGYGIFTGVNPGAYPNVQSGGIPQIAFDAFGGATNGGFLGSGSRQDLIGPEGDFNLVEGFSYLRGKHAFKFGFNYVDVVFDGTTFDQAQGQLIFSGLSDFLLGNVESGSVLYGNPTIAVRAHWYSPFAQDDWRVTNRLTLNLGLRWDFDLPPTERNNYLGGFNPNVNPATTSALVQIGAGAGPGALTHMWNVDHKDLQPRFGLAWDIKGDGKTVLRAGASLIRLAATMETTVGTVPFGASIAVPSGLNIDNSGSNISLHTPEQVNPPVGSPILPGTLIYNWVNNSSTNTLFSSATPTCSKALPCPTNNVAPNFVMPAAAEYNVDIQHAINSNLTVQVGYVGNRGFKEEDFTDLNQPNLGAGWPAPVVGNNTYTCITTHVCSPNTLLEVGPYSGTFPYISNIIQTGNGARSRYDSLQVTVDQRTSHGLRFLASYGYAHALDDVSGRSPSGFYIVPNGNDSIVYGNGATDFRHRFTFSPSYEIPGRKSPGQMLQGWTVSGILLMQSGAPWSAIDVRSKDLVGTGELNAQPNIGGAWQNWNYIGPRSAFSSGPSPIPKLTGAAAMSACGVAATAPYAAGSTDAQLATAALANLGCYVQGGGILTPPAYGTLGDAGRNIFRSPAYYNVDFSLAKSWNFKERYSAQFRVEFFNMFNRADLPVPTSFNPDGGKFGCSCSTPDSSNPVLGSGGPRHIQFGLKLAF